MTHFERYALLQNMYIMKQNKAIMGAKKIPNSVDMGGLPTSRQFRIMLGSEDYYYDFLTDDKFFKSLFHGTAHDFPDWFTEEHELADQATEDLVHSILAMYAVLQQHYLIVLDDIKLPEWLLFRGIDLNEQGSHHKFISHVLDIEMMYPTLEVSGVEHRDADHSIDVYKTMVERYTNTLETSDIAHFNMDDIEFIFDHHKNIA